MRSTGNLFHFTVFACERRTTLANVTVDSIDTKALILTGPRRTLVYVLLTVQTSESRMALTGVTIVSVHTVAIIQAWIWLTLILFFVAVMSHPASFTFTMVPMLLFNAFSMYTGLGGTVVSPREAQWPVGAGWTQALEPIYLVQTGAPTHTGV